MLTVHIREGVSRRGLYLSNHSALYVCMVTGFDGKLLFCTKMS